VLVSLSSKSALASSLMMVSCGGRDHDHRAHDVRASEIKFTSAEKLGLLAGLLSRLRLDRDITVLVFPEAE